MAKSCQAQIEIEVDGYTEILVCTMMRPHESHRATVYWSPTDEEVAAMLVESDEDA